MSVAKPGLLENGAGVDRTFDSFIRADRRSARGVAVGMGWRGHLYRRACAVRDRAVAAPVATARDEAGVDGDDRSSHVCHRSVVLGQLAEARPASHEDVAGPRR